MDIDQLKKEFLLNEILTLTINGAFGRAPIYASGISEDDKIKFRRYVRDKLKEIKVNGDLTKIIKNFADNTSKDCNKVLKNGRLRIGIAQKLINLYFKYLWALNWGKEPQHCPIDSIINAKLAGKYCFTKSDCVEDYKNIINLARQKANSQNISIPVWELKAFNRRLSAD